MLTPQIFPSLIAERFRIVDSSGESPVLLGRGGMGEVYRGVDIQTQQTVAIKVLKPEFTEHSQEIVARFLREGEVLHQLNHPNIVRHIDAVQQDGQYFLVMEYVPGGSLADLLAHQPHLPVKRILLLALELADALARAHHLGVIHRDLKPANVLLAEDGTPRLADFGVAYFAGGTLATQPGLLVGTLDYLSPEACQSVKLDGRADIWAFGVMLYEMLTGEMPFPGETLVSKLLSITTLPTPDLRQHCPSEMTQAPWFDDLVDLVYRMLEKDRQQRIPSMRLVGAELEAIFQACQNCIGDTSSSGIALPTWRGRFTTPPSLQTAERKHNLPTQPTPFVGREPELVELGRLLDDPQARLVTILGVGGMGKTRLALETAARRLDAYPQGVFFVALAGVHAPENILPALVSALQFDFDRRFEPLQQVLDYLREKHLLLVLDNFEHLLPGANLVTEIIQAAPGVQVLVTSRQRLGVSGEYIFHLEGMQFPEWSEDALGPPVLPWTTLQEALEYSAVKLFLQSARRALPSFDLQANDLQYVARICYLVQGMPLGILLAAAWVEMLSLREIADEISNGLDLLESQPGSVSDEVASRQRSVRAVFDYAWEHLSAAEQQVFQALAVFRGGFTRQAAQEVCGATLPVLMALVNKSLLHRSPSGRYDLHELLRQYAGQKLAENLETVSDRHCAFYSAYMERWLAGSRGPDQRRFWADIDLEYKNVQAAWTWAVQHGDVARLVQAASGLAWFYWLTDCLDGGVAAFGMAVDALQSHPPDGSEALLSLLLAWQGMFNLYRSTLDPAQCFARSLEINPLPQGDVPLGPSTALPLSLALMGQGLVANNTDRPAARRLFEQSVAVLRSAGLRWELADALNQLAFVIHDLGDLSTAQSLAEEALAIFQSLGDRDLSGMVFDRLGHLAWVQGRLDDANTLLRQTLEIANQSGHRDQRAGGLLRLGEALGRQGKFAEGQVLIREAMEIMLELGQLSSVASMSIALGEQYLHMGQYAQAQQACQNHSTWRWSQGFACFVEGMALLGADPSNTAAAQALLQESATTFEGLNHPESMGWALGVQAYVLRLQGRDAQAWRCVEQALRAADETKTFFTFLYTLPAVALLLADQGRLERAAELYTLAWSYGFVSNSKWFAAMAGNELIEKLSALPPDALAAARQRGRALHFPEVLADLRGEFIT